MSKLNKRLLLAATLALATYGHAENTVTVSGVGQVTKASVGLGEGGYDRQTSKASYGLGAEYVHWWRGNGVYANYNSVRSDAGFANLACPATCTLNWALTRREIAGGYVHRWRRGFYAGAGAGVFVTSAGWAPGGVVGLDSQFLVQGIIGFTKSLPRGLAFNSGVALDWYRAPNFSDSAYKGGRTVTIEPRVGISWTLPTRTGR